MEDYRAAKRSRIDTNVPPESDILRLVSQRESFRQQRRFADSDQIREELRSMGVELYDKEKEWRANDGRRGMLFTAGPAECVLSDLEIRERIREREDARKAKEWDRADASRDALRHLGVELDDKESVWRTSSGRSGTYTGMPIQQQMTGAEIRRFVAERERHRAAQDFDSADDLRRHLAAHGVEVFDNERLWRTSNGQQGVIVTGGHEVDCYLTDAEIETRVAQREEARSAKNWLQADATRDTLRSLGVELLDAQKQWCTTDGRHGNYSGGTVDFQLMPMKSDQTTSTLAQVATLLAAALSPGGTTTSGQNYSTMPQGSATFSEPAIIALVHGRERARERHDWQAADAIRADLRSHGVEVRDKEKAWRSNDGRSGPITRPP